MIHRAGITLPEAAAYELWELAAACGLHFGPTIGERDAVEIVEKKQAEWEQTGDERMKRMAAAPSHAERRRRRQQAKANG